MTKDILEAAMQIAPVSLIASFLISKKAKGNTAGLFFLVSSIFLPAIPGFGRYSDTFNFINSSWNWEGKPKKCTICNK